MSELQMTALPGLAQNALYVPVPYGNSVRQRVKSLINGAPLTAEISADDRMYAKWFETV